MAVFTPRQTAEALDVPERTLRNWSTRFGGWLSESARSQSGQRGRTHRRYESQDLETLRLVHRLAEQRLPLDEIAEVLAGRKAAPSARVTAKTPGGPADLPREEAPMLVTYHLTKPLLVLFQEQQRLVADLQQRQGRSEEDLAARLRGIEERLAALERVRHRPEPEPLAALPASSQPAPVESARPAGGILGAVRARFGNGRPDEPFARNLVRELARKRWGRGDLAVASGVSPEAIDRILTGQTAAPEVARALARALGVTLDDLRADR